MPTSKSFQISVLLTAVATFLSMLLFESIKQALFPDIGIWQSHWLTIGYSTFSVAVAAWFIFHKIDDLNRSTAAAYEQALRAEAAVRAAHAVLETRVVERTSELAALNRELELFSSSVAHDLRSPLRSIHAFAQALQEDCEPMLNDEGKNFLSIIRKETVRMGRLIDDLLNFARISRAQLEKTGVDLSTLARDILGTLSREQPGRQVECAVEDGMTVSADPDLMRVVMQNLLANAWKFTGKQAQPRIVVGSEAGDGETVYFVRDNGAGFDMQYAAKLFGPFQRLHGAREFEGTGIGLATAQRIVARHGGRVWAEGVVEQGATIRFTMAAL